MRRRGGWEPFFVGGSGGGRLLRGFVSDEGGITGMSTVISTAAAAWTISSNHSAFTSIVPSVEWAGIGGICLPPGSGGGSAAILGTRGGGGGASGSNSSHDGSTSIVARGGADLTLPLLFALLFFAVFFGTIAA